MNISEQIITRIITHKPASKAEFNRARNSVCGELKVDQPPNNKLLEAYQTLLKKKRIERDGSIERFLRKNEMRSQSGIAIITSLVKPYMCPGKCVYCPTEVRMPKSYIATEPAAARALRLDFSPYEQMRQRILMLERNGHPTDKIEYIIKGGTWNAYPLRYQYWFILESFLACNHLSTRAPKHLSTLTDQSPIEELQEALEKEQRKNERAKHRIIGLTLETRPDAIVPKTIYHMRRMGCTRIELGLQAPDDKILKLIQRGHTVDQFRGAMNLLRQAGFKVDLHFMPDLPGTTPEHDVEMYKLLFSDPALKPDMVKIYPNTVIPSAELYQWFLDGRYKPYGNEALFEALLQMKLATPKYCRISRLIRDIPATEIAAGNTVTNLREVLEARLKAQGKRCECLRCREISRQEKNVPQGMTPQLFVETYETVGGTEYFLSIEDPQRIAVYAFLRLRIPLFVIPSEVNEAEESLPHHHGDSLADIKGIPPLRDSLGRSRSGRDDKMSEYLPEIKNCAFIRELHTYGQLVGIGKQNAEASQHKGMGKLLVHEAENIVKKCGFAKIAVISGVGVRGYYRKLGYKKAGTYMTKTL